MNEMQVNQQTTSSILSSIDISQSGIACSPELLPFGPTCVFDAFWEFAAERQSIFFKRQLQMEPPWTEDPILSVYRFTNVYRASDRVSQFLIREVIYSGDDDPAEVVFRVLLFKLFNKIETWQVLERALGPLTIAKFDVNRVNAILNAEFEAGHRIYSAAYIMPSGGKRFKSARKHEAHLNLLDLMLQERLAAKLRRARSLKAAFEILRSFPLIGNFLAYQYAIDINYSEVTDFSESEFVAPGPGALSGLHKCFANLKAGSEECVIRLMTERQEEEFERREISFIRLGDRRLQLIDVQNLFCEVDKYARERFPNTLGLSNRCKIKQRFKPNLAPSPQWYPPKWGLNPSL